MTLVDNFEVMLTKLEIHSLIGWLSRFNHMNRQRQADLLKAFRIPPEQYAFKFVEQALERMYPAENEAPKEERAVDQSRVALINQANVEIAALILAKIDEALARTSDPGKVLYLKRRRVKFEKYLTQQGSPS